MKTKKGQKVTVSYEDRDFDLIVIDPDGIGKSQPSLGVGFRMIERYSGIKANTLSDWLTEESGFKGVRNNDEKTLKSPSGNTYRVFEMKSDDSNEYLVIEIFEWVTLIGDVLKKPGKVRKATKEKLIDFLTWFAAKGLYASGYSGIKDSYTKKDDRALTSWMMVRISGKIERNKYTDLLQNQGVQSKGDNSYAYWTNFVYEGIFGKTATEIKQFWKVVEGREDIARNYVSEEDGLRAIAHCEELVVKLFVSDLEKAHRQAIENTCEKFAEVLQKLKAASSSD